MIKIFEAAEAPITWDVQHIGKEVDPRTNSFVSRENLDSVLVRPGKERAAAIHSFFLENVLCLWVFSRAKSALNCPLN